MLPQKKTDSKNRFYIIDWAGSSPKGIPLFDVFKLCQSFQVPRFVIRRILKKHCALLDCELDDALSYLITALAVLGSNLNQFPRDAYMKLAKELFALGNSVLT